MREIRKLFAVVLALCLLLACTGCQNGQDEIYSQVMEQDESSAISEVSSQQVMESPSPKVTPKPLLPESVANMTPAPNDTLSGKLVFKNFMRPINRSLLSKLADEFTALHPNVTIEFDYAASGMDFLALSDAEYNMQEKSWAANTRVELISGEGDYFTVSSEYFNVAELSRSGILRDMSSYWENDPDIDHAKYFEEALDVFKVDGKLTMIPLSFGFNSVYLNRAVLEQVGVDPDSLTTVSTTDILDWYEKARETAPELQLFFFAPGKDRLLETERTAYLDPENKTASFDSPEFIRFLERTKNVINDEGDLDINEVYTIRPGAADLVLQYQATGDTGARVSPTHDSLQNLVKNARTSFAVIRETIISDVAIHDQPFEYMAGPYPLTDSKGQLSLIPANAMIVPASCSDPDLAWEFIKYCIEDRPSYYFEYPGEPRTYYSKQIALNKNNFKAAMEGIRDFMTFSVEPGYDAREMPDLEKTTAWLEQLFSMNLVNSEAYGIDVQEFLDEFYINELTTPEQAAQKIQGRAEIWLNE